MVWNLNVKYGRSGIAASERPYLTTGLRGQEGGPDTRTATYVEA
jgi:hypothetical protein